MVRDKVFSLPSMARAILNIISKPKWAAFVMVRELKRVIIETSYIYVAELSEMKRYLYLTGLVYLESQLRGGTNAVLKETSGFP